MKQKKHLADITIDNPPPPPPLKTRTEMLIEGRIQQARSRMHSCNQKAGITNCLTERVKMKAEAARQQAILDEYEILKRQIKEQQ